MKKGNDKCEKTCFGKIKKWIRIRRESVTLRGLIYFWLLASILFVLIPYVCYGLHPLHVAARFNEKITSFMFITTEHNVNAQSYSGKTPLHYAAEYDATNVTRMLTQYGRADPNTRDNEGMTPLHYAAIYDHTGPVSELLRYASANPNIQTLLGLSPLHMAVRSKAKEVLKMILETKEANVNLQDEKGLNALHQAVLQNDVDIVETLLNSSADPNTKSVYNATALCDSVRRGYSNMTISLLEAKADPNVMCFGVFAPLHMAIQLKNYRDVYALLECESIDLNILSKIGSRAPLHFAIMSRNANSDILRLLLEHAKLDFLASQSKINPMRLSVLQNDTEKFRLMLDRLLHDLQFMFSSTHTSKLYEMCCCHNYHKNTK